MERVWGIICTIITVIFLSVYGFVSVTAYSASKEEPDGYEQVIEVVNKVKSAQRESKLLQKQIAQNRSQEDEDIEEIEEIAEQEEPSVDKMNILVLGVDARKDNLTGRSDTMMVLSLNKSTNTIRMLSIPRDSYVKIVGKGKYDKITHAYAFGGLEMAKATVEELLKIKIDHYVVLNFTSFINIIDALGGIEVEVPFSFSSQSYKNPHRVIYFEKGVQKLNGDEALAYARMRKKDPKGDIGRGERQQQVVKAVMDKALSISSVPKIIDIYKIVRKSMDTDVGLFDIPTLVPYMKSFKNTESISLRGSGEKIDGIYYYKLDEETLNKARELLKH